MDRDALRALQAPLKERYARQPEDARVTLTATCTLLDEIACNVKTGRALAIAGLHPATGGDGSLRARATCCSRRSSPAPGVTLKAVATALEVPLQRGTITADGELDFRGTLGVDQQVPVGFSAIALRFDLDAPTATEEQLATLLKLTERYCVVLQTLRGDAHLTVSAV
jgi:hypothetical protein